MAWRISERLEIFEAGQCMAMMNATQRNISHFSVAVFAGTKLQFSTQVGSLKKVSRQYVCCCFRAVAVNGEI